VGGATILHAHSRDAAQQGFYDACNVARIEQQAGMDIRYPHRRHFFRTTTWKNTAFCLREGVLLLARARARARSLEPVRMALPPNVHGLPEGACKHVELVCDGAGRHSHWHVTGEDGAEPAPAPGTTSVAVDLGEMHPAALTDGQEAVVITARRLRAARQYTAKRLAEIASKQSGRKKGSRRWKQLQRRTQRFLTQQRKRTRDIEHTVCRAVVDDAVERKAGTSAIGDVRDNAGGERMGVTSQQKIGLWSHGKTRQDSTYKAETEGISVELVDEHDTSKTRPRCAHQYTPTGRVYRCPWCGFAVRRDVVGSVTSRSRTVHAQLAKILPPPLHATTYRHPAWVSRQGKRRPSDTGCASATGHRARRGSPLREAAEL
jgi:putative transposase